MGPARPPPRARRPPARAPDAARNSWLLTSLATVPAPGGPTWKTWPANGSSSGSIGGDVVGRAADHHAELARLGLDPPTRHRGVDEADAGGGAAAVQRPHDVGRVGREVDDARRAGIGGEHAVGAGHGLLDVGRSGQRQEHAPRPARRGGGRRHRRGTDRRRPSRTTSGRGRARRSPAATRWPAIGAPIVPVPTNPITVPPEAMPWDRRSIVPGHVAAGTSIGGPAGSPPTVAGSEVSASVRRRPGGESEVRRLLRAVGTEALDPGVRAPGVPQRARSRSGSPTSSGSTRCGASSTTSSRSTRTPRRPSCS